MLSMSRYTNPGEYQCKIVQDISDSLNKNVRTTFKFVQEFAPASRRALRADAVSLWSHDPVRKRLIHMASDGIDESQISPRVMSTRTTYSGVAIERKRIVQIKIGSSFVDGKSDAHSIQSSKLGFQWLVSIPILNQSNDNQVLYLLNLQYKKKPEIEIASLIDMARYFVSEFESILHDHTFREANILLLDVTEKAVDGGLEDLSRTLSQHIEHSVGVDAVGVYVVAQGQMTLIGFSRQGIRTLMENQYQALSAAECAVKTNREQLWLELENDSLEKPKTRNGSIAAVPIRSVGTEPSGAVVCIRQDMELPFTYDDITLVEALVQVFAPYHEMLFAEQQRLEALSRLGHELKGPVTGLRSALEATRNELSKIDLQNDYLSDLDGYTDSIANLAQEFELGTDLLLSENLKLEKLNLVRDLFAPTMRAMNNTLEERGYVRGRIKRPTLHLAPSMWLDRARMLQVIFNLLENAIKYSTPEPDEFLVEVNFRRSNDWFYISVRDFGQGIHRGFEQRIFAMGVRGPQALRTSAVGKGLGLAISRNIVRAHKGDINYVRHRKGSEFIIELPITVTDPPK